MPVISQITPQRRAKERVSVYLDGDFWTGMPVAFQARMQLTEGARIDEEQKKLIEKELSGEEAFEKAVHFLGYRARSEEELRAKLREKEYGEEVIDHTIKELEAYGFVNDRSFCEDAIEGQRDKGKSRRTTLFALTSKYKLDRELAEEMIELHYPEEDEHKVALEWAAARYRGGENGRVKLQRQLQARGFGWDVVSEVIRELSEGEDDEGF